jgi:hypothetical protein
MRWFSCIALLFFVVLWSCQKDRGNHLPVIEAIILDPAEIYTPGSDIGVTAQVTDNDGDKLEYQWQSISGIISNPLNFSTVWELSTLAEPLSYESITLTVSDGKGSVSKTKTIQISQGHIMSGHVYFAGTAIPVPGVEITIGKFSTVSGEDGQYSIEHLREGYTLVTTQKVGFDHFESIVYVDYPKSIYNISLASSTETLQLSGTIKTFDNITYEGLRVVLLNPDQTDSDLQGITSQDGTYSIATVPVGTRSFIIRNDSPGSHFLHDSIIYQLELDGSEKSYDTRIKIKRTLLSDIYLSEMNKWDFQGDVSDGFYLLGKGQRLDLKEYITIPRDAEVATFFLNSYVIGGCHLVGQLPSHRIWISNNEQEYMGGISWGGEGGNRTLMRCCCAARPIEPSKCKPTAHSAICPLVGFCLKTR